MKKSKKQNLSITPHSDTIGSILETNGLAFPKFSNNYIENTENDADNNDDICCTSEQDDDSNTYTPYYYKFPIEIDADEDNLSKSFPFKVAEKVAKKDHLITVNKVVWRYHKKSGSYQTLSNVQLEQRIQKRISKHQKILATKNTYSEIRSRIIRDTSVRKNPFNTNQNLVNCKNYVLKFKKNDIRQNNHAAKYAFTYCIDANFCPDAKRKDAPNFMKFWKTSLGGDKKKLKLLLQIIGYMCSDMTGAKKAFFFYGKPDSGKSIMTKFIQKLIGPEVVANIPIHELGARFSKASLFGKKANIYSEMKGKELLDITIFKSITGGDTISGEYKNKDVFSFDPKVKLLFAGNTFPFSKESEYTNAFLNRICMLVFDQSIPAESQDLNMAEKLWEERDIIFSLAMKELRKLKKKNFSFAIPDDTQKYLSYFEEEQNPLDQFIEEFCILGENEYLAITNFQKIFAAYCCENAFDVMMPKELEARLRDKFSIMRKGKLHRGTYNRASFVGITWKNPYKFFNDVNLGTKSGISSFQALLCRTEQELHGTN